MLPLQNNLKELWALYNFLALPNRPEGSGQLVNRASRPSASSPTTSEFVCETEVDGDASSEARNHDGDNEDLASLGDWPSFKQRYSKDKAAICLFFLPSCFCQLFILSHLFYHH